jgi:hypothetical protein
MADQQDCIAERLFAGSSAESELDDKLYNLGITYEKLGWDSYDGSLEIYGVPPDDRLSPEAVAAIFDCGFIKIYVNHTDRWETHYSSRASTGWRVSYPHKRDTDDGHIWVEEPVKGWPQEWTDSGYVQVKPKRTV